MSPLRGDMIPAIVLESIYSSPASVQMRDAALELATRISEGEYDDLDDMQRNDLQWLSLMLQIWARRVHALETDAPDVRPRSLPGFV